MGETALITDKFELRRNDKVTFRVKLEEGEVVVSRTGRDPLTAELPGARSNDEYGTGDPVAEEWSRLDRRWQGVAGSSSDGDLNNERAIGFELVADAENRRMTMLYHNRPAMKLVRLAPKAKTISFSIPDDGPGVRTGAEWRSAQAGATSSSTT